MKELLNNHSKSILQVYPKAINVLLNNTFLDLDIKGFSHEFCDILQYKYAKTYVDIVTRNTRQYGYTADEVENKYNLKHMRHSFACNNIDIDKLLIDNNFEYYIDGIRPQLLNLHLCTDINTNLIVLTNEALYPILTETNNFIIYK